MKRKHGDGRAASGGALATSSSSHPHLHGFASYSSESTMDVPRSSNSFMLDIRHMGSEHNSGYSLDHFGSQPFSSRISSSAPSLGQLRAPFKVSRRDYEGAASPAAHSQNSNNARRSARSGYKRKAQPAQRAPVKYAIRLANLLEGSGAGDMSKENKDGCTLQEQRVFAKENFERSVRFPERFHTQERIFDKLERAVDDMKGVVKGLKCAFETFAEILGTHSGSLLLTNRNVNENKTDASMDAKALAQMEPMHIVSRYVQVEDLGTWHDAVVSCWCSDTKSFELAYAIDNSTERLVMLQNGTAHRLGCAEHVRWRLKPDVDTLLSIDSASSEPSTLRTCAGQLNISPSATKALFSTSSSISSGSQSNISLTSIYRAAKKKKNEWERKMGNG